LLVGLRRLATGEDSDKIPHFHQLALLMHILATRDRRNATTPITVFPQGMTLINANIGFHRGGDNITYFHGHLPVFRHGVDDQRSFRMITSQLYINGSAKQSEICRAFGIAAINVKRGVKLYREKGIAGFYEEPRRRGAAVLTPPVLVEVQRCLDQGEELAEIATRMDLLQDTLRSGSCRQTS
jgi:transposase-like protein